MHPANSCVSKKHLSTAFKTKMPASLKIFTTGGGENTTTRVHRGRQDEHKTRIFAAALIDKM